MFILVIAILVLVPAAALAWRVRRRGAVDGARRILLDLAVGAALFGLVGPLAGLIVFLMLVGISERELQWLRYLAHYDIAYQFGALPAVLTGLAAGALKPALAGWKRWAGVPLIGAALGFAWLICHEYLHYHRGGLLSLAGPAGLIGGISLVSSWACVMLQVRRPRAAALPAG